jgi:hypothetical protein
LTQPHAFFFHARLAQEGVFLAGRGRKKALNGLLFSKQRSRIFIVNKVILVGAAPPHTGGVILYVEGGDSIKVEHFYEIIKL